MSSSRGGHQQSRWQQCSDGYWKIVPGDETRYYRGVNGQMYQVPRILDMTGTSTETQRTKLLQYLMTHLLSNNRGELVEVTRATITEALHQSTSRDPYGSADAHMSVQLTNAALLGDNGRSHMLHFRPENPEYSFFYDTAISREEVTGLQGKRYLDRFKKDDKGRKDGRGGGAGASGSSSGRGGRGAGAQQYPGGYSSSSGQNYQSGGWYGYSYAGQYYSIGVLQQFGLSLPQVGRGILNNVAYQGMMAILLKFWCTTLSMTEHHSGVTLSFTQV
ncbi:hypothetical protein F5Y07DRAFT_159790 [Xylaria sp. FL0933]|nr:hypothetical protein F5Y07DRAFT_159790 [Xylaria sp. FL0933]